ncbi:hypothetical protein SAMN04487911_11087 [Arenibacter nanhaiticus]|uniref:Fimbrillin-like n=1 Tax=Arenibacter nanhaiticus TaxID=558155 RepID=A0A1M6GAH8_9FLAO|nr:hypothetical protein [Arenibacter nanhaiticus]SHJ06879.1 hypothetical protein SAMN04487911_11087 [Arenibacter nanhaiticus]
MKKLGCKLLLVAILLLAFSLPVACESPFEGMTAVLSNDFIDYRVGVQVIDANDQANNPYPANAEITLSGEAIDQGLIYATDGHSLSNKQGAAKLVNNSLTLAVKPYTDISDTSPLRFNVKAQAPNYLTNTRAITIGSADSLQFLDIKLIKKSETPDGITFNKYQNNDLENGVSKQDVSLVLESKGSNPDPVVEVNISAGTTFKDVHNKQISSGSALSIAMTHFNNTNPAAAMNIAGGVHDVLTGSGERVSFLVAGAIDVTAEVGNTPVKVFSKPISVKMFLPPTTYHPETDRTIRLGDKFPVWSKDEASIIWNKEGNVMVERDASGKFFAVIPVSHLSVWMLAFDRPICATPVKLRYNPSSELSATVYITVAKKGGNGQLIGDKAIAVNNGDEVLFGLPKNMSYEVSLYEGSYAAAGPIDRIDLNSCATTGTLTKKKVSLNPKLYFDLETHCSNGVFRYSGPIDYKLVSSNRWERFSSSKKGKLKTDLLEWGKTYDFRIVYRGQAFMARKTVLKSDFRMSGQKWEYWGSGAQKQTFFTMPGSCE